MPPIPEPEKLTLAARIDSVCDGFEAEWRAGRQPRIESYLEAAAAPEREGLFRSLLAVEVELRLHQGEKVQSGVYRQRFPDRAETVVAVFRELSEKSKKPGEGATRETSVSQKGLITQSYEAKPDPVVASNPTHIGRFEILATLGEGGFGKVYKARDPQLDREVAIKVPRPGALETERDRERFLREARSAATIQHPNVCPVHEVGQVGNDPYIVMGLVPGQSLAAMLDARKAPMPGRQAALIVRKLALALEAAHAKGVIHRDLKPSNVMLDSDRKDVVIMDFGLARRIKKDEARLTHSGMVMGTPAYMSPEQARGDMQTVGPPSDVYSLGVMLYEMIAAKRPYTGSLAEVLGKILHVEPEPPSTHNPSVDRSLESICLKAMAKDPAVRFPSMKAFAQALDGFVKKSGDAELVVASPAPPPLPASPSTPSRQLKELAAALSADRKAEVAAAVARARVPFWAYLAGSAFIALIAILAIVFVVRSRSNTVVVVLQDLLPSRIDRNDPTLEYFLNGVKLETNRMQTQTTLKPGEYVLTVQKNGEVIETLRFKVDPDNKEKPFEIVPPPAPPSTPTQPPSPPEPEGFVSLFNGKDLTGWTTPKGTPPEWKVENGYMEVAGKNDIVTRQKFGNDFELHVEFWVPLMADRKGQGRGNSGVFLQGRQEIQILDSLGLPPSKVDCAAMYNILAPSKNACKPPEQWQTYDITYHAPRVDKEGRVTEPGRITLVHNGETVMNDLTFDKATVGSVDGRLGTPGPIMLQNHGNPVRFRNIRIRELPPKASPSKIPQGFVPLFNGKDLTGWKVPPGVQNNWRVIDGAITGSGPASHLFTERADFTDIHFLVEANINDKGNSGQYFRTEFGPGFPKGYEVQINSTHGDPQKTGSLYGLAPIKEMLVPPDTWFTQEVIARGNHIVVKVNGKVVVDHTDAKNSYSKGALALQQHHAGSVVKFRRIEVKELNGIDPPKPGGSDEQGFLPIFNGKDLTGWEGNAKYWRVEDGAIVGGANGQPVPKNDFLRLARPQRDFELRCEIKMLTGNSGIQVRSRTTNDNNFTSMLGPQVEISTQQANWPWGSLVTEPAGNPGLRADSTVVARALKLADFNSMTIRCVGKHITTTLNGTTLIDADFPTMPDEGLIAFQLHKSHPRMEVRVRNVRLQDLNRP